MSAEVEALEAELETIEVELQLARRCMERVSECLRKAIVANDHAPSQVREWFSLIDAAAMLAGHGLLAKTSKLEREEEREEADEFSGRARSVLGVAGRAL